MMRTSNIFRIFLFFLLFINPKTVYAEISSKIIAKVGNYIITNHDVSNEIRTSIFLANMELNQQNIDMIKKTAINNLVGRLVKKNEIKKYQINSYNKTQLNDHVNLTSKNLGVQPLELKTLFKKNKISYEKFIESTEIDLKWMSLIFRIYKRQVSVNPIEIENILKGQLKYSDVVSEFKLLEIEITKNNEKNPDLINNIYDEIETNGFISAVKKYSISETSKNNGLLGWVSKNSLNQKVLIELNNISKGDFTQPIQSESSIMILKIEDIKSTKRNIDLEKIKNQVIESKKEEKLSLFSQSHFQNAKNQTYIKFL